LTATAASVSTLTGLECSRPACDFVCDFAPARNLCPECQSPLLARYDLAAAARSLSLEAVRDRVHSMWRYAEVMPPGEPISLGEGMTPLLHAARYGTAVGHARLFIKDEGLNPTGSFKARGLAAAVSMAKALGCQAIALPTAGNAGGAAAAYSAHAGLACVIAMPADTPPANVIEARAFGAEVHLIDGLISDCGRFIAERAGTQGWFEVSTLKEPYRVEGKKTMGYELWEDFDGTLPDVIVYPTGGGVGLIGMCKAFDELEAMGLIGPRRPRMVAVQAAGCAPIVRAFEAGADASELWDGAKTVASGLRVPKALGDFIILADLAATEGVAVAVTDAALMQACQELARLEGIFAAPEGGAGLAAVARLVAEGRISADETVVVFNTGSGYKYLEAWSGATGV
jgi:threonine synthase